MINRAINFNLNRRELYLWGGIHIRISSILILLPIFASCNGHLSRNVMPKPALNISERKEEKINNGEFPNYWFSFLLIDKQTWIITDYSNKAWRTRDGGQTWQKQFEAKSLIELPSFIDSLTGYILVDSKLYRTYDSGSNWSEIRDLTDTRATNIKFADENVAFLLAPDAGLNYEILKSEDGGINWKLTTINLSSDDSKYRWNLHDIQFWRGIGVAAGNGKCLISNDFGDSWKQFGDIEGRFDRIDSSKKGMFLLVENMVGSSLVFDARSNSVSNVELPEDSQKNSYLFLSSWGELFFMTAYGELFKSHNGQKWNLMKIEDAKWEAVRQEILNRNEFPEVMLGETLDGVLFAIMTTKTGSYAVAFETYDKSL